MAFLHAAASRCRSGALAEVLGELGAEAYGMAWSPNDCELFAYRDGALAGRPTLEEAFEVRAFCDTWELRWIRDGEDGVATLISEAPVDSPEGWTRSDALQLQAVLERRYLLWGQTLDDIEAPEGWTTLATGRTRNLRIPIEAHGPRLALVANEHLVRLEHGNVGVFEQRLKYFADAGKGNA